MSHKYPIKYYDLQDAFALRANKVCGVPLADSYKKNTRFYLLLSAIHPDNKEGAWESFIKDVLAISDTSKRI